MRRSLAIAVLSTLSGCAFFLGPKQRPPLPVQVASTPEKVERGRYLAHHVTVCVHCHSQRDTTKYSMPIVAGTEGQGGERYDEKLGFPGVMHAPNITSDRLFGVGEWSDGELLRAIREGVDRDGETIFPLMPYKGYRALSDADAEALVAWVRTLPPKSNAVPERDLGFFVRHGINFVPKPLEAAVPEADRSDSVKWGEYLVAIADCRTCHTPKDGFKDVAELAFAGGWTMEWTGVYRRVSANLTPDAVTGLGNVTREQFIAKFKTWARPEALYAAQPEQQTPMPWGDYAGMTEEDLGAIYDYLRTLPPKQHHVTLAPPRG